MQTILSAATIPTYGTKSLENIIQDMYPTAIRVANKQYLHSHHPQIIQHFKKIKDVDVFSNERLEALIALLRGHVAVESTPVADEIIASNVTEELPTMIFVNTSKNAVKLAEVLKQQYRMDCLQYHKLCSFETRQENIQAFHSGRSQILICTDSASRGLDLPFVKRVIQMEMATNVVQ